MCWRRWGWWTRMYVGVLRREFWLQKRDETDGSNKLKTNSTHRKPVADIYEVLRAHRQCVQTSSLQVHGHNQCSSPPSPPSLNAEAMMAEDRPGVGGHRDTVSSGGWQHVAQEKQRFLGERLRDGPQEPEEWRNHQENNNFFRKIWPNTDISCLFDVPNMATIAL